MWKLLISDESRVDLFDCPVVRLPTSLAFARSNATSGLGVLVVVRFILVRRRISPKFDEFWLEQIEGMEDVTTCSSRWIKTQSKRVLNRNW